MNTSRPKRRLAAAAVAAVSTLALAACGGNSSGSSGAPSDKLTTLTPAGTGTVGSITWNVFEGEPHTIDPFQSADYTPNMINSNMCENLLAQTPTFQIKPNLAESYTNPDPTTWIYNLRKGVTFWDGSPMTADDVVWSMNHNLTDKTSLYNYLYANVASIAKTGPYQVTVHLKRPDYLFNQELASFAGVVVEKKFYEQHKAQFGTPAVGVMCTGPYKFDKWTQGQSITVSKYNGYWNKTLPLKVQNITFTFVTDDSTVTESLLSGQIDGTYRPPVAGEAQLKASSAGSLYSGPAPIAVSLVVANLKGAMGNLDMRKALEAAIDWKSIGKTIYGGAGSPISLQTAPSAYGFANSELSSYAHSLVNSGSGDVAEAKKFLAEAPADLRGKQISLVVPAEAQTQQLGVAIQSAAHQAGINLKLKVVPVTAFSGYQFDPKTRGNTDLLFTEFWPNIPNPLDWLGITAVTGATFNQSGYSGIDKLFAQAVGTKDDAARAKLVVTMEKQLREQMVPMLPGIELHNQVWLGKKITGAPAAFDYTFYPWAAYLAGK